MITFDSKLRFTVKSEPTVTINKEIEIVGWFKIPVKCIYDFTKIPEKYHNIALQAILKSK
jgi:hypothetical protein